MFFEIGDSGVDRPTFVTSRLWCGEVECDADDDSDDDDDDEEDDDEEEEDEASNERARAEIGTGD